MRWRFSIAFCVAPLVLVSCAGTNQQRPAPATKLQYPVRQEKEAAGTKPLTEAQASQIADQYWYRTSGIGCGCVTLEKQTANTWYYRVREGYAGKPRGLIAVDKRTGNASPFADYPLGMH